MTDIKLIKEPTVILVAESRFAPGIIELDDHLRELHPECFPDEDTYILPHDDLVAEAELIPELCGRGCYNSYGAKAGRKSNAKYLANLLGGKGKLPHRSVFYHVHFTVYIYGISMHVSHELLRHHVGATGSNEGSPSQESTRYVMHPGAFVVPPAILGDSTFQEGYAKACGAAYGSYEGYVLCASLDYEQEHDNPCKGMARKRIFETAARLLPKGACTSLYLTMNPVSLQGMFNERCHDASDLEFQRLACKMRDMFYKRYPNLFPQSNKECDNGV